jgi:hypothetical protein
MSDDSKSPQFDAMKYLKYSGTGSIPRGIEVLLKKAAVDPAFRKILLEKRAAAAQEIDLELTDVERTLLSNIPADQLEKIIANTKVPPEHRDAFLGTFGKAMLLLVTGAAVAGLCMPTFGHTGGFGHTLTPQQREAILRTQEERARRIAESHDANKPPQTNDINAPGK